MGARERWRTIGKQSEGQYWGQFREQVVRDKGRFKGICAAPHWEGGRTPLGSETLLALGKNLSSPPPRKGLSRQHQDGAQLKEAPLSRVRERRGGGVASRESVRPRPWGGARDCQQKEGVGPWGGAPRRWWRLQLRSRLLGSLGRVGLPGSGVASCSDTSCPAFSDCRQVSVQSPGWGRMPLFPTFSSPHSLGRASQCSGSGETAPFYSNVSSPLDFATASSAAPHQPL